MAILSGKRTVAPLLRLIDEVEYCWTSFEESGNLEWIRSLRDNQEGVKRDYSWYAGVYLVRCLKD